MAQPVVVDGRDPAAIAQALAVLRGGGLVAFPTDTVYGLAAALNNDAALATIYEAKQRLPDKALPVLMADFAQVDAVAVLNDDTVRAHARRLAERFWPGPLTLLLPKQPALPALVSSYATVGVRVPNHPLALALLDAAGPLAVTSANRSGAANNRTAAAVAADLADADVYIVDGGTTPGSTPSTVADITVWPPRIVRAGPVSLAALLA